MADVHDKKTRSYNMSRIRSTNTKPEMLVRRFLHANGFRYRLHGRIPSPKGEGQGVRYLPGKPDIVLPKYKTVIFVHGCFWHGHSNCKYFVVPKTRTEWWLLKINTNRANDARAILALKSQGWRVMLIWECQLKKTSADKALAGLLEKIR